MTQLRIGVGPQSAAERGDLANALLRADWAAALEPSRLVVLDAFIYIHKDAVSQPLDRRAAADGERAQAEATRRVQAQVHRYCAANRLNGFGTFTYAGGGHGPRGLGNELADFFRQMRRELGEKVPYLWVPEWHPGGHELDDYLAVGRYL